MKSSKKPRCEDICKKLSIHKTSMGTTKSNPVDYSGDANWAFLPHFSSDVSFTDWDPTTVKPSGSGLITPNQGPPICDVFYVHPTTSLRPKPFFTNHEISDERTDTSQWPYYNIRSCMKQHASCFSSANCDVYSPFYRQSTIRMYHEWISCNFDKRGEFSTLFRLRSR